MPTPFQRVSVITINKGRDTHLARLLEGLSRGQHPDECVVVSIGDDPPMRDKTDFIRTVSFPNGDLPLAAARNAGRVAASCDILIFLDVDCIPSNDLVLSLAAAARDHDGLICCEVLYLLQGAVTDGWTQAGLEAVGRLHPARSFPKSGVANEPNPGLFWSLAFAVRAATFDRLGGFDERFSGYGAEDTDLAFRAAAEGIPVLFTSQGRAFHQRHESFDPPLRHFIDIVRNANRFHARHGFWPMRDWLQRFVDQRLIAARNDVFEIIRRPTKAEIEASRVPPERAF